MRKTPDTLHCKNTQGLRIARLVKDIFPVISEWMKGKLESKGTDDAQKVCALRNTNWACNWDGNIVFNEKHGVSFEMNEIKHTGKTHFHLKTRTNNHFSNAAKSKKWDEPLDSICAHFVMQIEHAIEKKSKNKNNAKTKENPNKKNASITQQCNPKSVPKNQIELMLNLDLKKNAHRQRKTVQTSLSLVRRKFTTLGENAQRVMQFNV